MKTGLGWRCDGLTCASRDDNSDGKQEFRRRAREPSGSARIIRTQVCTKESRL